MSDKFLIGQECYQQILTTIDKIESCAHNQTEINQLWKDVKNISINEMGSLPSLPTKTKK